MQSDCHRGFDEHYALLLDAILRNGVIEQNARTRTNIAVFPGGRSFKIGLWNNLMPLPGNRKIFPYIAAAEIAWYLLGSRNVTWLQNYARIWDKFAEVDGVIIKNAYGFRWRRHFGRDQILEALRALEYDSTNRQILVSAWDPSIDGLTGKKEKNVPCPTHFTLNIVQGVLHSSLFIRSSDVFVGLPYDVLGHALLMKAFSCSLQCKLGSMHVTLAHAHIYEPHFEMAKKSFAHFDDPQNDCEMPEWTILGISKSPDPYVGIIKAATSSMTWPKYNPKPELIV